MAMLFRTKLVIILSVPIFSTFTILPTTIDCCVISVTLIYVVIYVVM